MPSTQTNSSAIANRASVLYKNAFWRIVPLLMACYTVSYLNRINVGFAKLQMSVTLGLSESVFGIGAGVFFIGYFIFGLPSNLLMQRFGAHIMPGKLNGSISSLLLRTWALIMVIRYTNSYTRGEK
jgi:sugar phosphate permease